MSQSKPSLSLNHAVSINEDLKRVIAMSREINVVAINALLISKRAGDQSAGFRVVALELRAFSEKICDVMDHLGQLIFRLVRRTAELLKQEKSLALLLQTADKCQDVPEALLRHVQHLKDLHDQVQLAKEKEWQQLVLEVQRSLPLCRSAAMLSNNGRIEAAYGNKMLDEMLQISRQIDDAISQIIDQLKHLNITMSS
jgi:hypothetical protein